MSGILSTFPPGFIWGASTSAYQVEGACDHDGRGESIWDRFSRTVGKVASGHTGDIACDHYNRVDEDVMTMAALGLGAYRFSIAWPRIFPTGRGRPNEAGVDFYRRLIDALHQHGILPMATLYHWDLPQALQDTGGWTNRDTAHRFADYAAYLFGRLGAAIPFWVTHNEPFLVAFFGHAIGHHAPGRRHPWELLTVAHHLVLSHGLAVRAFRTANLPAVSGLPRPGIGIVLNIWPNHPASQRPRDLAANRRFDAISNRFFLEVLFRGHYPPEALAFFRHRLTWPRVKDGDLETITQRLDFFGFNTYSRLINRAAPLEPLLGLRQVRPLGRTTAMGWEIYPPSLYEAARLVAEYTDLPLYVTENGAAFDDRPQPDGSIDDAERIDYLRSHLVQARRAIAEGIDLRGYFVWSLLDNLEWAHGYHKRFGLIHVDFSTQRRTWKRSATWYRNVIARNGLDLMPDPPAAGVLG